MAEVGSQFNKIVAEWVYRSVHYFDDPLLQEAMDLMIMPGFLGLQVPNARMLREELLDEVYNDSMQELSAAMTEVRSSEFPRPVSLVTDGWKNVNSEHVVNMMLVDAPRCRDFFYTSVNTENTTSDSLFQLLSTEIDRLSETFSGGTAPPLTVSSIITDAANMRKCGAMLEQRYKCFWSIPCQCHALNLVLTSWSKLKFISTHLERVSELIAFIRNHGRLLKLYREKNRSQNCRKELVRPCTTRFATYFLVLRRLLQVKGTLVELFLDHEYRDWLGSQSLQVRNKAREHEADVLGDSDFWMKTQSIEGLLKPVFQTIREFDRSWNSIGYVWQAWSNIKRSTKKVEGAFSARQIQVLKKIVKKRERDFKTCKLFGAAHCLNPRMRWPTSLAYTIDSKKAQDELFDVARQLLPDPADFRTFVREFMDYLSCSNIFEKGRVADLELTNAAMYDVDPYKVWTSSSHLAKESKLRFVACSVLGIAASNSSAERNFSANKHVHSKKRNQLASERVRKLVYIFYNSRMKKKKNLRQRLNVTRATWRLFPPSVEEEAEERAEAEEDFAEADLEDVDHEASDDEASRRYIHFGDADETIEVNDWEESDFEGDDLSRNQKYKFLEDLVPFAAVPAADNSTPSAAVPAADNSMPSASVPAPVPTTIPQDGEIVPSTSDHVPLGGQISGAEEQEPKQVSLRRSTRVKRQKLTVG